MPGVLHVWSVEIINSIPFYLLYYEERSCSLSMFGFIFLEETPNDGFSKVLFPVWFIDQNP